MYKRILSFLVLGGSIVFVSACNKGNSQNSAPKTVAKDKKGDQKSSDGTVETKNNSTTGNTASPGAGTQSEDVPTDQTPADVAGPTDQTPADVARPTDQTPADVAGPTDQTPVDVARPTDQ